MAINYKKELEAAAKSMILVHNPDTLIKMIMRRIVQQIKVSHAGILLYDKDRDTYVLTVSRGPAGLKIPAGFTRMDKDNPLVSFFSQRKDKKLLGDGVLIYEEAKKLLRRKKLDAASRQLLRDALYQLEIFETVVCIPSYFRDDLLGILLLGKKRGNRKFWPDEIDFFVALTSDVAMAIRNAQLFRELELELERKHRLFIHTTIALAAAVEAKDPYTHGHTERVTDISLKIANLLNQKNKGALSEKFLENLHIASLLHDIGKIGIPEAILNKNSSLEEDERKKMQEHPVLGSIILQPIPELNEVILGVKYHHEKFDGSGYPEGLDNGRIPLIAAIISAADTFDAMTTDRPYRKALSKEEAIKEIGRISGKQLDPQIASALLEVYQKGEI